MIKKHYFRTSGSRHTVIDLSVLKAFLIAIVVPDVETLCSWAQKKGFEGSFEELCRNKVRSWSAWCRLHLCLAWSVPSDLQHRKPILFLTSLGCQKSYPRRYGETWEGCWSKTIWTGKTFHQIPIKQVFDLKVFVWLDSRRRCND